jgi:hypothetical protein
MTKDKYGASNLNGPQMVKKYCFHPAYHLLQDSILNPSKSIPTWKMEKPGFDKNSI